MSTMEAPTMMRKHPALQQMLDEHQGKFLSDAQLAHVQQHYPQSSELITAAREVRDHAPAVIETVVVRETCEEYPWESVGLHKEKGPRDNNTILAFATMAMLFEDPQWFDNRVLIWFKTMLQSFDFPDKTRVIAVLSPELEAKRKKLPVKVRAIFQNYSRLREEFERCLTPTSFELFDPYLEQVINTLTENY